MSRYGSLFPAKDSKVCGSEMAAAGISTRDRPIGRTRASTANNDVCQGVDDPLDVTR